MDVQEFITTKGKNEEQVFFRHAHISLRIRERRLINGKRERGRRDRERERGGVYFHASQPRRMVARATRLTPRVKAPMRRSQAWVPHISLRSLNPLVM